MESEGHTANVYYESLKKCYWNSDEESVSGAYELVFAQGSSKFRMILDDYKVFLYEPYEFHVDATATIYDNNILGNLTSYTIPNIDAAVGGYYYASNDNFTTSILDGSARFKSTDTSFAPTVGSTNFDEVSLFTNAVRTLDWLESIGYTTFGSNRITIVVHDTSENNALYQPDSTTPLIKVGEGDGSLLQNLSTDADVVSHELAHHVVYNSITRISGESLVLHEGLADFFTFARTGDSCLGESICPASSNFCYVQNECLRTADNDLTYGSSTLPTEPHLRSQLISGFLWDFIQKDGVPSDVWAGLVLKSVNILNSNSGYEDLLLSLLVIDAAEYSSTYCSEIYNRAEERGFSSLISRYNCETIAEEAANSYSTGTKINSIVGTGTTEQSSSSSSSSGWCGAVAGGSTGTTAAIFLIPLLVALRRRKD